MLTPHAARGQREKDEGGRVKDEKERPLHPSSSMKDEGDALKASTSSFILPPSSFVLLPVVLCEEPLARRLADDGRDRSAVVVVAVEASVVVNVRARPARGRHAAVRERC